MIFARLVRKELGSLYHFLKIQFLPNFSSWICERLRKTFLYFVLKVVRNAGSCAKKRRLRSH